MQRAAQETDARRRPADRRYGLALPRHSIGSMAGATLTLPLLLIFVARALDGATGGNISVACAYVADLTRDQKSIRRVAFGRMGMATSLGFAIGPAVAGLLGATRWGTLAPVAAAAVISGMATILCLGLRDPGGRCPEGPLAQPALTRVLGQQQRRCDRRVAAARPGVLRRRMVVVMR